SGTLSRSGSPSRSPPWSSTWTSAASGSSSVAEPLEPTTSTRRTRWALTDEQASSTYGPPSSTSSAEQSAQPPSSPGYGVPLATATGGRWPSTAIAIERSCGASVSTESTRKWNGPQP